MFRKLLGQRLRRAREMAGVNRQIAADVINAPRTALTQIESGKRAVSSLELTKLAALYHRSLLFFLEENRNEEGDTFVAAHRATSDLADAQVRHLANLCVDLGSAPVQEYLRILHIPEALEGPKHKNMWMQDLRDQAVNLALELYRQGEISRGRLLDISKIVHISADGLLNLAQSACAD